MSNEEQRKQPLYIDDIISTNKKDDCEYVSVYGLADSLGITKELALALAAKSQDEVIAITSFLRTEGIGDTQISVPRACQLVYMLTVLEQANKEVEHA